MLICDVGVDAVCASELAKLELGESTRLGRRSHAATRGERGAASAMPALTTAAGYCVDSHIAPVS